MINDINNLKEIVVEESYVLYPEETRDTNYMLKIDKEGIISEYDYQDNKYIYYKAEPEKVLELFKNIKLFMDSIVNVEIRLDDVKRVVTLNYERWYSESIPSLSIDKDNKHIIDLIYDFIESSCVKCKEEEL